MRWSVLLLALFSLLAGSAAARAGDLSVYSDACWHREAGDLLGQRIGILHLSDAAYVFFQSAEGVWTDPLMGKASLEELRHHKLVFALSSSGKPISFRGTISEKMIEGRFNGQYGFKGKPLVVRLKRVPASSKAVPDCR